MEKIKNVYPVAEKSIGPPSVYLGANIQKLDSNTPNKECWGASAEQYVREAVKNVKARLKQDGFVFNKKLSDPNYSPDSPFSNKQYRPELDTTQECNDEQTNFYQNLLGVLRWIIELGRIDINFEVSVLSHYLVNPRLGHLQQALHIFKYLDIHKESFISFDPTPLHLEEPSNRLESPEARATSSMMEGFSKLPGSMWKKSEDQCKHEWIMHISGPITSPSWDFQHHVGRTMQIGSPIGGKQSGANVDDMGGVRTLGSGFPTFFAGYFSRTRWWLSSIYLICYHLLPLFC